MQYPSAYALGLYVRHWASWDLPNVRSILFARFSVIVW